VTHKRTGLYRTVMNVDYCCCGTL